MHHASVTTPFADALLVASFVLTSSLGTVLLSTYIGLGEFKRINRLRLIGPSLLVVTLGGSYALFARIDVADILLCYVLSELLSLFTAACVSVQRFTFSRPSKPLVARLISRAAQIHPVTLLSIGAQNVDRLWIISSGSSHDVGIYFVSLTVASTAISSIGSAAWTVWLPKLQTIEQENRTQAFISLMALSVATIGGACIAGSLLSYPIVRLLFGTQYVDAAPVTALLFVSALFMTMRQLLYRCVRAFSDFRTGVSSEIAYILGFAALALAYRSAPALTQIIVSLIGASFLSFAWTLYAVSTTLEIRPSQLILRTAAQVPNAVHEIYSRLRAQLRTKPC
jgi:O-antigen/teichoic acid export membrane protein